MRSMVRAALLMVVVVVVLVGLVGGSAAQGLEQETTRPRIAVTTNILGDVVSHLVGGQAQVDVVMPVGASPHEYQASAEQAAELRRADALIINGGGFEEGLAPVIEGATADGVPTFAALSAVRPLRIGKQPDPHFFTDPARMAIAARGIVGFLVSNVPSLDDTLLRARAARYVTELEQLDRNVEAILAPIPPRQRVLVTNHEAFAYLAQRYRFDVVGAVIPAGSTGQGASAGELASLADLIQRKRVGAIFAETTAPAALAEALRSEVCGDVDVVELYSESLGEPGSGAATYVQMMRTNARRIAGGLAHRPAPCAGDSRSWLPTAFQPAFMQRALLGGLLAVLATSLVGTWVVMRGLAFLGDALAHGVIPGVALAVLMGFSPVLGALAAALLMSGLVSLVSARTTIREDTGIGLLFVGMLSLGIIIISRSRSFSTDVTALLFGDVLGVTGPDLRTQAIAAVVVATTTVVLYRPFLALTFNRQKAFTLGMRPKLAQAALLTLLAVSIVASFQAIGTLLVFGLLIAPPATAALFFHRVPAIMAAAVALGVVSVVAGLFISFHQGTAGGATIAGVSVAIFFLALSARELSLLARRRVVDP